MAVPAPDVGKQLSQDATAMTINNQYNTTSAGKGARLSDAKIVLREIDAGQHPDQVRDAVIEDDILGCGTQDDAPSIDW
jgi:hypothetical protein